MAAPQLSLVHALSHLAPAATAASANAGDERQQAPDKACDTCLLLAHLGPALSAQPAWASLGTPAAVPAATAVTQLAGRAPAHFQARAPPLFL